MQKKPYGSSPWGWGMGADTKGADLEQWIAYWGKKRELGNLAPPSENEDGPPPVSAGTVSVASLLGGSHIPPMPLVAGL